MKKRILSMMLSVMLLLLPVLSQADGFLEKAVELIQKGYEVTVTSQFIPGDGLISEIGDETTANALKELFDTASLSCSFQSTDDMYQFAGRLLLGGQEALEIIFGKNSNELLLTTDLLGDDVYAISKDELKDLLAKADELSDQNRKAAETIIDAVFGNPCDGSEDEILKITENILEKLLTTVEENTEDTDGETLLLDGRNTGKGILIRFPAAKVGELTADFVNQFMNIPQIRDFLTNLGYQEGTQNELAGKITGYIRRDPEVRFYLQDESVIAVIEAAIGPNDQKTVTLRMEEVIEAAGDDIAINGLTVITNAAGEQMKSQSRSVLTDKQVTTEETVTMTENGKEKTLLTLDGNLAINSEGEYLGLYGTYTLRIPENEVTLRIDVSGNGHYAEDELNYDQTLAFAAAPDLSKPLITTTQNVRISLAEAYLTGEGALHPAKMTEKEQSEKMREWQVSMTLKLITLLPKLPESLQNMLFSYIQ